MTTKKNSVVSRVDPDFFKDMIEIGRERYAKNLAKSPKEINMVEMTKLLRRTEGYKLSSLNELKFKPKKENLK